MKKINPFKQELDDRNAEIEQLKNTAAVKAAESIEDVKHAYGDGYAAAQHIIYQLQNTEKRLHADLEKWKSLAEQSMIKEKETHELAIKSINAERGMIVEVEKLKVWREEAKRALSVAEEKNRQLQIQLDDYKFNLMNI